MKPVIQIPAPCHQNWNHMTPAKGGKHCAVCDKVVKDFTQLSSLETAQYVANSKTSVCGRVPIAYVQPTIKKSWFAKVLAFLTVFIVVKKTSTAQTTTVNETTSHHNKSFGNKTFNLHLKIKDETSTPVAFAQVIIKKPDGSFTQLGTVTDINGIGYLTIPEEKLEGNVATIQIKCMSFEDIVIDSLYLSKSDHHLELIMKSAMVDLPEYTVRDMDYVTMGIMVGGVVTIKGAEYTEWVHYDNTDTTKTTPVEYKEEPIAFKAYPNPTNGLVNVECNKEKYFDLMILDELGRLLLTQYQVSVRKQIDLSEFVPGTYYIQIMQEGKLLDTKKVVRVRGY